VTASNFIYDTVRMAADAGFQRMLFVGHIGKLVKVAGGIRNTHSQYGDHRMEILTEIAEGILFRDEKPQSRNGSSIFESLQKELSDCVMTDEAINILRKYGLDREVCAEMTRRIQTVMQEWALGRMQVEVVVFSNAHGELGRTENALAFMQILQDQVQRKL
jgi:cobalt-precorrin-5B (C1)-methyltransferase